MLPVKYPKTVQPLIPSYNYSDVDEGTGITTYNGLTADKSTGTEFVLTTASPYSFTTNTSGNLSVGVTVSGNFLTGALNRPRIVKGTAVLNMTWRVTNSSGDSTNYPSFQLLKYDGSTYTQIGYVSGTIISSASGISRTTALQISNISATLIKAGEQIVVRPGITGVTAGNSPKGIIACDPQNRDPGVGAGNYDTSKLIANIPFKIVT